MVLVVGQTPSSISVTREQYLALMVRLDTALHSTSPTQVELAREVLDIVRTWMPQIIANEQVDGQLELPLDWDRVANEAARARQ